MTEHLQIALLPPRLERSTSIVVYALATVGASGTIATQPAPIGLTLALWAAAVAAAASVDLSVARLPDQVVLPAVALTFVGAAVAEALTASLIGGALLGAPLLVVHLLRPDGLGFGDVKYGVLLGAGLGLLSPILVLPAYLLAAFVHVGLCRLARAGRQPVPFGPALALAALFVLILVSLGRS